ncbi:MAG: PA0069 family radical SAM protein, partial [Flavobacteriales bacterium]|nr:PA0069 family radical SAM protein [Flavobacteriales bacterium]
MKDSKSITGRGAQFNPTNPFLKQEYVTEHIEGLDEPFMVENKTHFYKENPKTLVNKVNSPDIGLMYSMNPYQGCEHGCAYCYARPTHQYWGLGAGLDFERKILVKEEAPQLLRSFLDKYKGEPKAIMLSGNTDCYQPVERKLEITRKMLQVLLDYRYPVGIITKNSLITRDLDILRQLAAHNLVIANISVTSLDKKVQQKLEPRTASVKSRLDTISKLTDQSIPVNVMIAPVIPGLTSHEVPAIVKEVAKRGASSVACVMVRLNGAVAPIFADWAEKNYPDRAKKILN